MTLASLGLITPLLAVAVMILSIFAILLNTLRVRAITFEHVEETEAGPFAEIEYHVPSMVCEGCAEKISAALSPVIGVREVTSKIPHKRVRVRYEPGKVHAHQLKEALGQAGHPAMEA